MANLTEDPTILKTIEEADIEMQLEEMMKNRPTYTEAIPGTNPELESGNVRGLTSTAVGCTFGETSL